MITNQLLSSVANTIRGLAMDAVQKANSGHPGVAMGMADVAAVLWLKYLKIWANEANWMDRDRFILSGGHGSALIYSLLHLAGYKVSIEDLKQFRQMGSITPGHPEYRHTDGVEVTTGPLGQGIANGVGLAIAEKMLATRFDQIVDHRTWMFCGDGDLEEGISHEVASMAGNLGLDKLVLFYDSNHITIEGDTDIAMTDNAAMRFKAYGWAVAECDGHDFDSIDRAIQEALAVTGKPVIVICHTIIGKGSPNKSGTAGCHGSPLGAAEVRLSKEAIGLNPDEDFAVSDTVYAAFAMRKAEMEAVCKAWHADFDTWAVANAEAAAMWQIMQDDTMPANMESVLPAFDPAKTVSTRVASGIVLNALAPAMPQLVGGAADLSPSTMTYLNGMGDIGRDAFAGRNFHYGVRETGMAGVMNGVGVHGGFRVFGATFFVFCDYCRPVMRVAALMKLPVIYVLTHDSFYVGEDGPTHEPVEQLPSLRAMPGLNVIRPADATETAAAWQVALETKDAPTCLLLSRQNLPVIDRTTYPAANNVAKGAYTLWQTNPATEPDLLIVASGSEVSISLEAAQAMTEHNVRVVSMPCWELFEQQTAEYRASVFPASCTRRLAVEAAIAMGWEKYIGSNGATIAMEGFGASGPCDILAEHFGFTTKAVIAKAQALLQA